MDRGAEDLDEHEAGGVGGHHGSGGVAAVVQGASVRLGADLDR